jgi:hypothetical protein
MKSNEFVEIKVIFKKETLNEMNQYVLYQNLRNEKAHRKDKPIDLTVEDFITGCVNAYLNKLEYINTPPLENFTKPYHLKNHFKELMEKRKLKQKDICEATEIAAPIISRILQMKINLHWKILFNYGFSLIVHH